MELVIIIFIVGFVVGCGIFWAGIRLGEIRAYKNSVQIMSHMAEEIARESDPSYGLKPLESPPYGIWQYDDPK